MANKIISSLNGKVVTTSLNQLLGGQNLGITVRGFSPCLGMSPKAVDPCRRNRIFIASSNARASLSLKRCRQFVSGGLGGCSGIAANGVCSRMLRGRQHNSCLKQAIRMVPRVASTVGSGVGQTNRDASTRVIVARVNKAINSVRSRPFVRTVQRVGGSTNTRGMLCVRTALVPCLRTTNRVGAGPARRDIHRLHNLKVRPGVLIMQARTPIASDVHGGVTVFYSISRGTIVRSHSIGMLCRVPLGLRGRNVSRLMISRFNLSIPRTSVHS